MFLPGRQNMERRQHLRELRTRRDELLMHPARCGSALAAAVRRRVSSRNLQRMGLVQLEALQAHSAVVKEPDALERPLLSVW
jgi:hypothetical protein